MKSKLINFSKKVFTPKEWTFASQIFVIIFVLFASFIAFQLIINNYLFSNFYTNQQFNTFKTKLSTYVSELNSSDPSGYYNDMYEFTAENNVFALILDENFDLIRSQKTSYSIDLVDTSSYSKYNIFLPNTDFNFEVGQEVRVNIELSDIGEESAFPIYLQVGEEVIFDNECTACVFIEGLVTEVYLPTNLNHLYSNNQLIVNELYFISQLTEEELDLYQYEDGFWYKSETEISRNIVFLNELNSGEYSMTVLPLQGTDEMLSILSAYNFYAYLGVFILVIGVTIFLSRIVAKPIRNIEKVAKSISDMNFEIEMPSQFNIETRSLSNSILTMAQKLEKNINDLNVKNKEIMELYDEQTKQLSLRKRLVSSISHELKTPLMIMQVSIQGILDEIFNDDESTQELENVIKEIATVDDMLHELFEIYKLDNIDMSISSEKFSLSKLTKSVMQEFDNLFKSNSLKCKFEIQDDVYIEGDQSLIKRVITNYTTNALKYTPENNNILVSVSEDATHIRFSITNYGINISNSDISHLWEPFYRVDKSGNRTTKTRGTGLGLYLVKEILDAHSFSYEISNVKNGVKASFEIKKGSS